MHSLFFRHGPLRALPLPLPLRAHLATTIIPGNCTAHSLFSFRSASPLLDSGCHLIIWPPGPSPMDFRKLGSRLRIALARASSPSLACTSGTTLCLGPLPARLNGTFNPFSSFPSFPSWEIVMSRSLAFSFPSDARLGRLYDDSEPTGVSFRARRCALRTILPAAEVHWVRTVGNVMHGIVGFLRQGRAEAPCRGLSPLPGPNVVLLRAV